MASGFYEQGLLKVFNGTIDIDTSTLKIMLLDATAALDPDETVVSTSLTGHEISVTNYTGGFAGGGRKTATITLQINTASNRLDIAIADLTWTALGAGATIGAAALIYETGAADSNSIPIAFFDVTDTPCNGGDITLDFLALGSGGNLRIAV